MPADPVQRRLAAILAADVVGYSRLMGDDEEGTLAALTAHRTEFIEPSIAEHRGRVVKTTGDGLLAEFASVVDAVRCAVAFQEGMAARNAGLAEDKRIQFRIGVNLGDVIVQDDDVYGDGVNVAARLEGLAEPGSIIVSGGVHEQVRGKIDVSFDDLGPQQVKNIAEPVRAYAVAKAAAMGTPGAALPLPDKPSIAVLPFTNMSGDPEQEYFADGITEDIITELSRFRSLFVIARNSSFMFRNQNVDVGEVGRRLGVRYVVEGSVRKGGNRVRVTAQLVDALTGGHLWAERYDRELEDIFAVQDELTQAIAAIVPGRLEDADRERAKRKPPANMTAYDLVLLGTGIWRRFSTDDFAAARAIFENAVTLDPQYARAHAGLAWTHVCEVFLETGEESGLDEALRHGATAIALDDSDGWSHGVMGQARFLAGQDEEAEIELRRAVSMNPNDADVAAMFANILIYWGRFEESLDWIGKAKRLNPFSPGQYHWYHALALYSAGEYVQAVATIKEMRYIGGWFRGLLAASYAQLDRNEDARHEAKLFIDDRKREFERRGEPLPLTPLELASARAALYRDPAHREHFLEGLRKAGLPE